MENRFGIKDLILYALVIGLGIMIFIGMQQDDRQFEKLQQITARVNEQARDIRDLRNMVSEGVPAIRGGDGATTRPVRAANLPVFRGIAEAQSADNYAPGDWVVDAFGGGVAKLTPLLSGDAYASNVQSYVIQTLCDRNENLEWNGLIAESWEIEDHVDAYREYMSAHPAATQPATTQTASTDEPPAPVIITFKLRKNVRFSDGQPLTADDVVFTFDLIMNPQVDAPRHRAYFSKIRRVEKLDDHTVRFVFNDPYFQAFELAAGFDVLPKHFYSKFSVEEFNRSVGYLMGSGPYRMEDPQTWKPGMPIRLVRNDRYWGAQPAFDRLIFQEITNDVARLTAFRNGQIDLFGAQPEQYRDMLNDQKLLDRTQQFEYQNPIGGYRYVAWNEQRNGKPTMFADKRVRQAMTLLTDRQTLINDVMLGYAQQATGPFNPTSKQYDTSVKPWPYDPARAKELLAEAGWQDRNKDGVLENEQGEKFIFKLTYPSGTSNYERMVLMLKDGYSRAGIAMELDPLEWAVFTERIEKKDFTAITLGWTAGIETDIFQMFHSSQAIPGGDNFMSYKSDKLDALIDEARSTIDEETRMPIWHEAHRIMHEDQPYTFLFFPKTLAFMDKRFEHVRVTNLGLNPRVEWYVPRDRQRWTKD